MDKITFEEAEELLLINKHELDDDCVTQPSIFHSVGDQFLTAKSIRDKSKKNLAEVDATIAKELRLDADTKGTKLSEAKLQELIILDNRHKEAFAIWAEDNLISERWELMKESFSQRSFMLKDVCSLFYTNYYIRESIHISREAVEKETDNVKKKLADNRNRNKSVVNE
jgi:hypothetical protein